MKKTKPANNTNQPTNQQLCSILLVYVYIWPEEGSSSLPLIYVYNEEADFFRISSEMPTAKFLLSTQMLSVTCYRRRSKPVFFAECQEWMAWILTLQWQTFFFFLFLIRFCKTTWKYSEWFVNKITFTVKVMWESMS